MFGKFRFQDLKLQNIVFYVLALIIVVMIFAQQASLDAQRQSYDDKVRQLAEAQKYNSELQEKLEYVGTDEYREEKAREEGYVEEDEIVFVSDN